jgi:hypothetical protein
MAKTLNKIPTAVLAFNTAEDVLLTNNNTGIGFLGYDSVFAKVVVGDIIKTLLASKVDAKLAVLTPPLNADTAGSVVRLNPTTPKSGDIKTVRPVLDQNGAIVSGRYEVYIYVNSTWRLIFPRS